MIDHASSETRPSPTVPARAGRAWTTAVPRLLAGLALLGVAMAGTAAVAPGLALGTGAGGDPGYAVIAVTGVAMILLSSLFLAYAGRVIGLGLAWLALALVTNALLLVGKFVLAPFAYYRTTFVEGDPFASVQSQGYFPILAAGLLIVSAAVLGVLYAWSRGSVTRALGPEAALRRPEVVFTLLVATGALGVPVLVLNSLSLIGYGLTLTFATGGLAVLVALLALATGAWSFGEAARTSVSMRDTAVVTAAAWLALSLLLVYHVVWVVFMSVLVSLWPLKTVAPSGK